MTEKKKILIVTTVFPPEPVTSANLNYDLAVRLSEKYNVTVIHPKPTRPAGKVYSDEEKEITGNFSVVVVPSYTHPQSELVGRMRESYSFGKYCARYIKKHSKEIKLVYNCSWQLFGYYVVAKACVKCGIPYIIPIQDVYPETLFTSHKYPNAVKSLGMAILSSFDKYYLRHATVIRTISDEMKSYLLATRGLKSEQFLVVNNWQDDENFVAVAKTVSEGTKVFAYVGNINAHSNVELMIQAFIKADLSNARFIVYGGGAYKERCQTLVNNAGCRTISFSYVERKDVPMIQAEADVLILALPKGNGTFCLPSKLTSYMLSGRPVLASVDVDSTTAAFISQSGAGMVVPPDDLEALCEAFKKLSDMKENDLAEMGRRSREFAEKNLTREVNLSMVVKSIEGVLQK